MMPNRFGYRTSFNARLVCTICVVLISFSQARGDETGSSPAPTPPPLLQHLVLTGKVTGMGVAQLEPGATPQVSFYLEPSDSNAGMKSVLIVIPAPRFYCTDGERATLEGDLSPAKDAFPPILLSPKLLSCNEAAVPQ